MRVFIIDNVQDGRNLIDYVRAGIQIYSRPAFSTGFYMAQLTGF